MSSYTITLFDDTFATDPATVEQKTLSWESLKDWLKKGPHAATKSSLRLLSQTVFGDKLSPNGSLRWRGNVLGAWGCELDYDGESVPFQSAVDKLKAARVRFFAYTSPSHRPDAPRWRVVLPFDRMEVPKVREVAAERGNAIVGGWVARESFWLAQPFYAGHAEDAAEFLWAEGEGDCINRRDDLPRQAWLGAESGKAVSDRNLLDMLYDGEEVHNCITALAFRGWSEDAMREEVENSRIRELRGEKRYAQAFDDIRRGVTSAVEKRQKEIERKLAQIPPPPRPATVATPPEPDLFCRVADMTAVYRQSEWLIGGHIEHPTLCVLFGDPENGKSFVGIDWACCVATGRRWNGKRVLQGPVLYLAGEGFLGLSKRFLAWRLHNGISDADWKAAPLFVSRRAVDLLDLQAGQEMWATVEARAVTPRLIVIDTLSRMTPGMNESAADEMSKFVQWCDRTKAAFGCTILVVHHSGVGDKLRVRGSSVLKGATDVEIGAKKDGEGRLKLFNTKMKEARRFNDRFFVFQDVQLPWIRQPQEDGEIPQPETSAVLVACEAPAEGNPQRHSAVEQLRTIIRQSGGKLDNADALEQFVEVRGGNLETARKTFYKARKKGMDAGTLIFDEQTNLLSAFFV
jgi:hypothetical protein